jgi:coproporphyrinogen III oxidase-like Fe-S oxidoreductase
LLAEAGYAQYEVSAYARDGARCRHNLNYWLFGDYVGVGAGAHGKISLTNPQRILRTTKPKQPREYQSQVRSQDCVGETTQVDAKDLPFEFMLNALRLNEGFKSDCYEARTGLKVTAIEEKLQQAESRGLLEPQPGGWRPTGLGRRFLNDLTLSFLP